MTTLGGRDRRFCRGTHCPAQVCLNHQNKASQTGGLNSRDLFLAVLETRVRDQGVGSVGFFQGLSSWLGDDRVSSPTFPLCLCVSASKVPLFFFFNIYLPVLSLSCSTRRGVRGGVLRCITWDLSLQNTDSLVVVFWFSSFNTRA